MERLLSCCAMRGEIDPGTARVAAALERVGQPQVALRGRCALPLSDFVCFGCH